MHVPSIPPNQIESDIIVDLLNKLSSIEHTLLKHLVDYKRHIWPSFKGAERFLLVDWFKISGNLLLHCLPQLEHPKKHPKLYFLITHFLLAKAYLWKQEFLDAKAFLSIVKHHRCPQILDWRVHRSRKWNLIQWGLS